MRIRLGALLAIACLLAPAFGAGTASAAGSFEKWLHKPGPDTPFRYYGFCEAVSKYFRYQVLWMAPDPRDLTTTRTSSSAQKVSRIEGELAELEDRLAQRSHNFAGRTRELEDARREQARLLAEIAEGRRRIKANESQLGGDVQDAAGVWDKRTRLQVILERLNRRLDFVNNEVMRAEMGRISLMQKKLEDQIHEKRAELATAEADEYELFLPCYKPLLLVTLGAAAILGLVGSRMGRRRRSRAAQGAFALVVGIWIYTFLAIMPAAGFVPVWVGVLGAPSIFAGGLTGFMVGRAIADPQATSGGTGLMAGFYGAVALMLLLTVRVIMESEVAPELVRFVYIGLSPIWYVVWAFAALRVLESDSDSLAKCLMLAGIPLATAMLESMTLWLGTRLTLTTLVVSLVPAAALMLAEFACAGPLVVAAQAATTPEQEPQQELAY